MLEIPNSIVTFVGGCIPVLALIYHGLRLRFQKLWMDDMKLISEQIEKDTRERIAASHADIIRHFENKFELLRRDIDNISDCIKQLRGVIERYQEQQMESQIEKVNSLMSRSPK